MIEFLEGLFASTFWTAVIKVVAAFALLMVTVLVLVWLERRLIAAMQNRIGPNRAGPFGLLQTVADGVKLFFKESIRPRRAEFGLYLLAPIAAAIPAFLIFLVIPIGRPFTIGQTRVTMQVADLNVAILFVLAMSSIAVYSIVLSGWASGSKYPLLGGVRATAQMISYETAMALSLVPVVLFASAQIAGGSVGVGTMSLSTIVELQAGSFRGPIPGWFVFWLVPSFIVFFIAGVAETNRPPFDMVEAESELVGGYHTEYSGVRFALFFLAEYISMFNIAALTVTLFLGGWLGPDFGLPPWIAWAMPTFWFLLKTYALVCVFVWIRASLPRMRYDRLMTFGWKRLIPFSLAWLVLFALLQSWRRFGAPWG